MDILLNDISVSFGNRKIINNFSEEIKAGEYIAITGASGRGKSTLLNIIGLLESVQKGTVQIGEYTNPKFNSKSGRKLLTYDLGYIFQNYALIENKTVADNLNIIRGKNKGSLSNEEALAKVGLTNYESKKVYTLSGGEQQRVAIARLLIKNPSIILADEPTGSLDKENRNQILQLFKELNEKGKTIIVVTHDDYVASQAKREVKL